MGNLSTVKYKKIYWSDIANPSQEFIQSLGKKYKFHELDLEDILSEDQRSKIDDYEKYLFLVLHFPVFDKRTGAIKVFQVNIFIGQKFIITLHDEDNKVINDLINECKNKVKARREYMSNGTGFLLYEILARVFDNAFKIIDKIEDALTEVEKDVFDSSSEQKDMLKDILLAKKNINTFRRLIGPQRVVLASLEHKTKKLSGDDLENYFDDIVDDMEKIWNNLEELRELAGFLQDTNESVLTHRTNNTIKVLTVFSVIMLPLTVITGFYGMNVQLPFSHMVETVWYILVGMAFLIVAMMAVFKHKKLI